MNRKSFIVAMTTLSSLPFIAGCKIPGGWGEEETQKLAATLEQAGFVLSLKLGEDPKKRQYLELAASSLETAIADGKLDPNDILTIVLANVKNDDVVIGISTALTIYRIWWNDSLPATTAGVVVISALVKGLRDGLAFNPTVARSSSKSAVAAPKDVVPTFKSKSLDNAVKAFFEKYDSVAVSVKK